MTVAETIATVYQDMTETLTTTLVESTATITQSVEAEEDLLVC